jgi:hypothetical protein
VTGIKLPRILETLLSFAGLGWTYLRKLSTGIGAWDAPWFQLSVSTIEKLAERNGVGS